ncbi:hypothetical protein A45J_2042 [hot springs metagenome]|uniref:Uncharacterized protein n=1 Tax=hot springs metagenome TaxID=433727 RepID=A0A5J4L4W2_9ZZZZ
MKIANSDRLKAKKINELKTSAKFKLIIRCQILRKGFKP